MQSMDRYIRQLRLSWNLHVSTFNLYDVVLD